MVEYVTKTQFTQKLADIAELIYNNTDVYADKGIIQMWIDIVKNNASKFSDDLLEELQYNWVPDIMSKLKDLVTDILALGSVVLKADDF
jgi:hypothetical protein